MSRNTVVSTHSRPKAADPAVVLATREFVVSTHSRPKAAGFPVRCQSRHRLVSTHSRPKAAASMLLFMVSVYLFQHTAARRRLQGRARSALAEAVSTHSRPKAAGFPSIDGVEICRFQHTAARRRLRSVVQGRGIPCRFNTQPPEGGW